jgi:hypothetical protein
VVSDLLPEVATVFSGAGASPADVRASASLALAVPRGGAQTTATGAAAPPPTIWRIASKFPGVADPNITGPGADPDHDGVPNIVEFAFGRDPSTPDPALAPLSSSPDPTDPSKRLLEFIRPKGLGGISYLLQVSDALTSWENLTATPQIIDLGNGLEKVVVSDTPPLNPNLSRFILLSVGTN